jgi:four helix bundle protein
MSLFRFEDLEIWKRAVNVGGELCALADRLDEAKKWRFAEQLRAAALSISNNIAEGSGSASDRDFANFLNIAKRSIFENANMMFFFAMNGHLSGELTTPLLHKLNELSRMVESFRQRLASAS